MKRVRPAASPSRPGAGARLAAVEAEVAALRERLAALEARVGAAPGDPELDAAVLAAVADLDARLRYGGLVPIPDLRGELRRRGVAADDAAVTAALERLERAWRIDLGAAQAPAQVADRGAGIDRPGRGLLYYVTRRPA